MRRTLLICASFFFLFSNAFLYSVDVSLKMRQPNWKPHVIENYSNGNPALVIFYEPINQGEIAVKQIKFFPEGSMEQEMDLIELLPTDPLAQALGTTIVGHGAAVSYHPTGQIAKAVNYERGIIHGDVRTYFVNGQLESLVHFEKGLKEGPFEVYFAQGKIKEKGTYCNDKLHGEYKAFYEDGGIAERIVYEKGLHQGKAEAWYPQDGGLKAVRLYRNGLLNSESGTPAVTIYNSDQSIQEVQDFRLGTQQGVHVKYYPNGKPSYRVNYVAGQKDGEEQWFQDSGAILGGGLFRKGIAVGEHLIRFPNGNIQKKAVYTKEGKLQSPIEEFYENGEPKARYFLVDGTYEGDYQEWYPGKKIKCTYHYKKGAWEGEEHEFFSDGSPKMRVTILEGKKEGLHQEWYENRQIKANKEFQDGHPHGKYEEWHVDGTKKTEGTFVLGKKEGKWSEWSAKGILVFECTYKNNHPEGVLQCWHGNGQLKQSTHFIAGHREGEEKKYYENGQLMSRASFVKDALDGVFESWYFDGSLQAHMNYAKGLPQGEHIENFPLKAGGISVPIVHRIYHYDERGNLDGEQRIYHPNGNLAAVVHYDHGVLHGLKAQWNDQNVKLEEGILVQGKLNGPYFQRNPQGEERIITYRNGKKEGSHQVFYPSDGVHDKVKRLDATFVDDELHGELCEYNETGVKIGSTLYQKGKKEGLTTMFFPSGTIMMTVPFQHDLKEGKAFSYYPEGSIHREVTFHLDLREGETRTYNEEGILTSLYHYHKDQMNGPCKEWNDDGILVFEGEYHDGKKHGIFKKYYDDGSPKLVMNYQKDELVGDKKVFPSTESKGHLR